MLLPSHASCRATENEADNSLCDAGDLLLGYEKIAPSALVSHLQGIGRGWRHFGGGAGTACPVAGYNSSDLSQRQNLIAGCNLRTV